MKRRHITWDESRHPRDDRGRFATKAGAGMRWRSKILSQIQLGGQGATPWAGAPEWAPTPGRATKPTSFTIISTPAKKTPPAAAPDIPPSIAVDMRKLRSIEALKEKPAPQTPSIYAPPARQRPGPTITVDKPRRLEWGSGTTNPAAKREFARELSNRIDQTIGQPPTPAAPKKAAPKPKPTVDPAAQQAADLVAGMGVPDAGRTGSISPLPTQVSNTGARLTKQLTKDGIDVTDPVVKERIGSAGMRYLQTMHNVQRDRDRLLAAKRRRALLLEISTITGDQRDKDYANADLRENVAPARNAFVASLKAAQEARETLGNTVINEYDKIRRTKSMKALKIPEADTREPELSATDSLIPQINERVPTIAEGPEATEARKTVLRRLRAQTEAVKARKMASTLDYRRTTQVSSSSRLRQAGGPEARAAEAEIADLQQRADQERAKARAMDTVAQVARESELQQLAKLSEQMPDHPASGILRPVTPQTRQKINDAFALQLAEANGTKASMDTQAASGAASIRTTVANREFYAGRIAGYQAAIDADGSPLMLAEALRTAQDDHRKSTADAARYVGAGYTHKERRDAGRVDALSKALTMLQAEQTEQVPVGWDGKPLHPEVAAKLKAERARTYTGTKERSAQEAALRRTATSGIQTAGGYISTEQLAAAMAGVDYHDRGWRDRVDDQLRIPRPTMQDQKMEVPLADLKVGDLIDRGPVSGMTVTTVSTDPRDGTTYIYGLNITGTDVERIRKEDAATRTFTVVRPGTAPKPSEVDVPNRSTNRQPTPAGPTNSPPSTKATKAIQTAATAGITPRERREGVGTIARRGDLVAVTTTSLDYSAGKHVVTPESKTMVYEVTSVSRDGRVTAVRDLESGTTQKIKNMGNITTTMITPEQVDIPRAKELIAAHTYEGHPNQRKPFDSLQELAQILAPSQHRAPTPAPKPVKATPPAPVRKGSPLDGVDLDEQGQQQSVVKTKSGWAVRGDQPYYLKETKTRREAEQWIVDANANRAMVAKEQAALSTRERDRAIAGGFDPNPIDASALQPGDQFRLIKGDPNTYTVESVTGAAVRTKERNLSGSNVYILPSKLAYKRSSIVPTGTPQEPKQVAKPDLVRDPINPHQDSQGRTVLPGTTVTIGTDLHARPGQKATVLDVGTVRTGGQGVAYVQFADGSTDNVLLGNLVVSDALETNYLRGLMPTLQALPKASRQYRGKPSAVDRVQALIDDPGIADRTYAEDVLKDEAFRRRTTDPDTSKALYTAARELQQLRWGNSGNEAALAKVGVGPNLTPSPTPGPGLRGGGKEQVHITSATRKPPPPPPPPAPDVTAADVAPTGAQNVPKAVAKRGDLAVYRDTTGKIRVGRVTQASSTGSVLRIADPQSPSSMPLTHRMDARTQPMLVESGKYDTRAIEQAIVDRNRTGAGMSFDDLGQVREIMRSHAYGEGGKPTAPRAGYTAPERAKLNLARLAESTDPKDNGAKIRALDAAGDGSITLYRRHIAGPSGQTATTMVGRVRIGDEGYEIVDANGDLAGLVTAVSAPDGKLYYRTTYLGYDNRRETMGYATSLATAADAITNGAYAATGRHDTGRIGSRKLLSSLPGQPSPDQAASDAAASQKRRDAVTTMGTSSTGNPYFKLAKLQALTDEDWKQLTPEQQDSAKFVIHKLRQRNDDAATEAADLEARFGPWSGANVGMQPPVEDTPEVLAAHATTLSREARQEHLTTLLKLANVDPAVRRRELEERPKQAETVMREAMARYFQRAYAAGQDQQFIDRRAVVAKELEQARIEAQWHDQDLAVLEAAMYNTTAPRDQRAVAAQMYQQVRTRQPHVQSTELAAENQRLNDDMDLITAEGYSYNQATAASFSVADNAKAMADVRFNAQMDELFPGAGMRFATTESSARKAAQLAGIRMAQYTRAKERLEFSREQLSKISTPEGARITDAVLRDRGREVDALRDQMTVAQSAAEREMTMLRADAARQAPKIAQAARSATDKALFRDQMRGVAMDGPERSQFRRELAGIAAKRTMSDIRRGETDKTKKYDLGTPEGQELQSATKAYHSAVVYSKEHDLEARAARSRLDALVEGIRSARTDYGRGSYAKAIREDLAKLRLAEIERDKARANIDAEWEAYIKSINDYRISQGMKPTKVRDLVGDSGIVRAVERNAANRSVSPDVPADIVDRAQAALSGTEGFEANRIAGKLHIENTYSRLQPTIEAYLKTVRDIPFGYPDKRVAADAKAIVDSMRTADGGSVTYGSDLGGDLDQIALAVARAIMEFDAGR